MPPKSSMKSKKKMILKSSHIIKTSSFSSRTVSITTKKGKAQLSTMIQKIYNEYK